MLFAQTPDDPAIARQIKDGMEKTILNDFAGAKLAFQQLIEEFPDQPYGYFYLGATMQAEMLDLEDFSEIDSFKTLMKTTIDLAGAKQEIHKDDPWPLFAEGCAHLYHSFMDSKTGKMWGAYRNAVKGTNRLVKAIELDSTFYDAYLGVGSYRYWKSAKGKMLTWLPFISDEREKGLKMVEVAVEKGRFSRLVAKDQLAWILLHRQDYERALQMALENHQEYPESRFFMWTLVEIYYKSGKTQDAYNLYEKLLKIVQGIPDNNHYNEMTCLLRMAEISCSGGDYKTASLLLENFFRLELDDKIHKRSKKKRKRAEELQDICSEELARGNSSH